MTEDGRYLVGDRYGRCLVVDAWNNIAMRNGAKMIANEKRIIRHIDQIDSNISESSMTYRGSN